MKNSGVSLTDQEIETIFAVADLDGDGQIDMGEFCQLLGVGGGAKVSAPAGKLKYSYNIFGFRYIFMDLSGFIF